MEVLMPKWGLTMKEGKVSKWLKSEGDNVAKGEGLLEVETEKITNKVDSPADGILFQIVVPAGETVAVKTVLALLAEPGETPERCEAVVRPDKGATEQGAAAEKAVADGGKKTFVLASPIARRLAREWNIELAQVPGTGPGGRVVEEDVRQFKEKGVPEEAKSEAEQAVNASPAAVEAAKRAGVDLSLVTGSGPGGRITKVDVLRAINPAFQKSIGAPEGPLAGSVIPMEGMRKIIADNMMASLKNAAQLSVFLEFDATEMQVMRDKIRAKYNTDGKIKVSYNDIIALAVCRSLSDHPIMNSALTDEGIVLHEHVNLGIAVALSDGLVVPNVKNAHQKSLLELGAEIRQLAGKARQGGLTMDDIQGGTFTITNVSMLGVDGFTPILNPPEVGILGVGRAVKKPAVVGDQICIRTMMTLSLTFDHRIVDGAPANRFLRTLADYLEDPVMLLG